MSSLMFIMFLFKVYVWHVDAGNWIVQPIQFCLCFPFQHNVDKQWSNIRNEWISRQIQVRR